LGMEETSDVYQRSVVFVFCMYRKHTYNR
jgi:hypothetical protein